MNDFEKGLHTFRAASEFMKQNPEFLSGFGAPDLSTTMIGGEKYLAISYGAEQKYVQPLRLIAALAGLMVIMPASKEVDSLTLKCGTWLTGVALTGWSLWTFSKAHAEMRK
jgi:nicotinamide riboside transporter PnuC